MKAEMVSKIYTGWEKQLPQIIRHDLNTIVNDVLKKNEKLTVFFRADDIGPPSKNFSRMMDLFIKYKTPICLAVVPVWMTQARWDEMMPFVEKAGDLFCWHVHGYMHKNYEVEGKKHEFGPARNLEGLFNDLSKGRKRLERIMGNYLTPVFTPPWNRCSFETMEQLGQLGYKGISRSYGSKSLPPDGFKDFPVHVDLHTRKDKDAQTGWENLFSEFKSRMKIKPCGIMLHHMRMNDAAFIFLEYLLELFSGCDQIEIVTYRDLI